MPLSDIPPPGAPSWLVPVAATILAGGFGLWIAAYVLQIRRSLADNATAVPLLALGLNLAWEAVFALYVADLPSEKLSYGLWLLVDVPLVYATVKTAQSTFRDQPLVARHAGKILALTVVAGTVVFWAFVVWWFERPEKGYVEGSKVGKQWKGRQRTDQTELAYWTAMANQLANSVGSCAMVLQRGHSGGQSYAIW